MSIRHIRQSILATLSGSLPLSVTPNRVLIPESSTLTFTGHGGRAPYAYSLDGSEPVGTSINPVTGVLTTGVNPGPVVVIVTDSLLHTAQSHVYVGPGLSVTPNTLNIMGGNIVTYSGIGGVPPYTYTSNFNSHIASMDAVTGIFTTYYSYQDHSGAILVEDDYGSGVGILGTISATLEIIPTIAKVDIGGTYQFAGHGGVPTRSFSIHAGVGSINVTNGLYTAPGAYGSATVRLTDSDTIPNTVDASIAVAFPVTPNHFPEVVLKNTTRQFFSAASGTAPFAYTKTSGIGSIDAVTGIYTAPNATGVAVIESTDATAATSDVDIAVTNFLDTSVGPLNGTTNYLNCGNILNFGTNDPHSGAIFIKWPYSASDMAIMTRILTIGMDIRGWILLGRASDRRFVAGSISSIAGGDALLVTGGGPFPPNEWGSIVYTYDGSNTPGGIKFYLNGVLGTDNRTDVDNLSGTTLSPGANFNIGAASAFGSYSTLTMCNAVVANRVLTAAEALEFHNGGSPGNVSTMSFYGDVLNYWYLGQNDTYPNLVDQKSGNTAVMTNMSPSQINVGDAPV